MWYTLKSHHLGEETGGSLLDTVGKYSLLILSPTYSGTMQSLLGCLVYFMHI